MLDLKTIRENPEAVKTRLKRRGGDFKELDELLKPEEDRRSGLQESELLKNKKKKLSAEVGQLKQKGQDASNLMEEVKTINISIKELDDKIQAWEQQVQEKLLGIPNTPDDSIPDGADESANRMVRDWGTKPEFAFKPKNHVEVGEQLGLIDLKRAAKISGARFAVYKGQGAGLLRALINFMIDVQTRENGYQELYPPFLVNKESMLGTGQLPKFEEELFATRDDPLYLIPTAEVPVTNFHRDEILEEESLPICYAAYTPCFRREAGSYGKDTQGLIRQHQFDKVELVKFSRAEESSAELEKLVENAESILKKLNLHYRVVELCAGDLGFSAAKTYDLEVWLPSQDTYREISSCSNFADYQARRARIRCKKRTGGKPEFVHTLNGSGLAAGRLFVALLENYQQEDGTVMIPEVLRPYMHGQETLKL
ncbi:MAG: serine--tRNA ligase [Nitrospina sp.]|jgi:seryl-tRNA synthetase|nr:serine--tRNA ligase [Nitrospina sp.]MBT3414433.1 serine--tRNA ligase [Nitrospina sp.]MBT3855437.1 serine--tRNA ligase [Nitrospina sp.]MBT4103952.1 serine--tRNA ligase [Nitrospina sp.]MBT4388513.1 serine--tRNA ligase [Nitrospina sp.]